MYGWNDLKPRLEVTATTVACPVRGCATVAARQARSLQRAPEFLCAAHGIYLSPSTFEYVDEQDNILWHAADDLQLLAEIRRLKRESRMRRDNSEDALTWNVLRYLDRAGRVGEWLAEIAGQPVTNAQLVYWSYDPVSRNVWAPLARARAAFGELPSRSSEPDVVAVCDQGVFWVEAKLTATNRVRLLDIDRLPKYLAGGDDWHRKIFALPLTEVMEREQRYELGRFWLIGSWLARKLRLPFRLISLVRGGDETDLETEFGRCLIQTTERRFLRYRWEDFHRLLGGTSAADTDAARVCDYLEQKTIGYGGAGRRLIRAFPALEGVL